VGSDGKLTSATIALLTSSIETAVKANACSTCTVTIKLVVEISSKKTLYEASARQLQTGSVGVTFSTFGGTSDEMQAVVAQSSSASFASSVTTALRTSGGADYAGVTTSAWAPDTAANNSSPSPLWGLLGLLALLLLVPLGVYFFVYKKKTLSVAPVPKEVLVIREFFLLLFCFPSASLLLLFTHPHSNRLNR
jgi:hypothetical protein